MSCLLCSPRKCNPGYLYVVFDARNRLSKIGCTVNLAMRTARYRENGAYHITREYSRVAGCRWSSMDREARALRLLAGKAERVRGDWFACDPDLAISCVDQACGNYSGARWK